jgi:ABC-type amino acid transport system permease subunit
MPPALSEYRAVGPLIAGPPSEGVAETVRSGIRPIDPEQVIIAGALGTSPCQLASKRIY